MSSLRTIRQRFFERSLRFQNRVREKALAIADVPREKLQAAVDYLEIPVCGCKPVYERVCAHKLEADPPCRRQSKTECDCSWHAPPCEHVAARLAEVSIEEWAAMLLALDPAEYDEPLPPDVPVTALAQEDRILLMGTRHGDSLGLYHPVDEIGETDIKIGLLSVSMRNQESGEQVERIGRSRSGRVVDQRVSKEAPPK